MTEDEAKAKWCPFVRQPQAVARQEGMDVVGGCNADAEGHRFPRHHCIGSACMAWRWKFVQTNEDQTRMSGMWPPMKAIYERTDQGGCGLAGSPQ
jgi:hypothetical protein